MQSVASPGQRPSFGTKLKRKQMDVIYLLIGCSLGVALLFLGAFWWATRSGQYEDTVTPAIRMLFDPETRTSTDTPDTTTDNPTTHAQ